MFTLEKVVPWGRSFDEYRRMFALTESDLRLKIVGCGDGPADFNAEATRRGSTVSRPATPAARVDQPRPSSAQQRSGGGAFNASSAKPARAEHAASQRGRSSKPSGAKSSGARSGGGQRPGR